MRAIRWKSGLALLPVMALCPWWASPPAIAAGNPTVDCDAGESLQEKIDSAKPGFTISVTGTCNERITVETDDLTLDGGGSWVGDDLVGGATIDGTGISETLVQVRGARVTIRGFTIRNSQRSGVAVSRSGFAVLHTNLIEDNRSHGIVVNRSAYGRIGDNGFGHVPDEGQGNIIRNNGARGINVRLGGSAGIFHNKILSNDQDGIRIIDGASADVDGNLIDANDRHGINIIFTSAARLSANGNHGEPNTISNNAGAGVRCLRNSSLRGDAQGFDNNTGGNTSITGDCASTLP